MSHFKFKLSQNDIYIVKLAQHKQTRGSLVCKGVATIFSNPAASLKRGKHSPPPPKKEKENEETNAELFSYLSFAFKFQVMLLNARTNLQYS